MRKRSSRKTTTLRHSFIKKFDLYVLGASAAAAAALTTGSPAAGEVVYTPAHRAILPQTTYGLDLNQDGIVDFVIKNNFFHYSSQWDRGWAMVSEPNCKYYSCENGIESSGGFPPYAACLPGGSLVGPSRSNFFRLATLYAFTTSQILGFWGSALNRYLGLRFQKDGQNYYGWARLSTRYSTTSGYVVILSGYAYENVPDTPIVTGLFPPTGSEMDSSLPSLGMLAAGSQGLPLWRQKNNASLYNCKL